MYFTVVSFFTTSFGGFLKEKRFEEKEFFEKNNGNFRMEK